MSSVAKSEFDLIDQMARLNGRAAFDAFTLPATVIPQMETAGVDAAEIDRIVGPRRHLDQRIRDGAMLTEEESDRVVRLAHIVNIAEKVFKSREKAFLWLRMPNDHLGGNTPIDYLRREFGARFVEEELIRIDYGINA